MLVPLGEWTPDAAAFGLAGLTVATNCVAAANGHYEPWRDLEPVSAALAGPCLGAAAGKDNAGNAFSFAGTGAALWRLGADGGWSDASVAGGYATGAGAYWRFASFGTLLVATNGSDPIQAFDLGGATQFAALGSNAPKARYLAVVRDFLVAGHTDDTTDGERPLRVRWSPIADPAGDWTPSAATQADFQDLAGGDAVTGIVGGELGLILCERSLWRMSYAGPPTIFQLDEIAPGRGCVAPGSIATDGRLTIFLSEDGFYSTDGATVAPIGAGKLDRWFFDDADPEAFGRMSAIMDPTRQLYILAYRSTDAGAAACDRLLIYNWVAQRWTVARGETQRLCTLLGAAQTLEGLDDFGGTLEALPASLDSRQWVGGTRYRGAFDGANRLATFSGAALTASFETGEAALGQGVRAMVQSVRPLADGLALMAVGARDAQSGPVAWTADRPATRAGAAGFRSDARFHRARLTVAGDWTKAQAVEIGFVTTGGM